MPVNPRRDDDGDDPAPREPSPFLEPRHADAIVEAARSLNFSIARAEDQRHRDHRESLAMLQRLVTATERVAEHMANLPALMSTLERSSNGHGSVDDQDGDGGAS